MRSSIFLFVVLLVTISCQTATQKTEAVRSEASEDASEEALDFTCAFKKNHQLPVNTYPFDVADQIELVAYKNRSFTSLGDPLIKDGKFGVPDIQQRATLNKNQSDSLFSLLFNITTKTPTEERLGPGADCYNPRNAIVFYQKGQAIAFLEMCFECGRMTTTNSTGFGTFCEEKWCLLQKFFVNNKIDYGVTEEACYGVEIDL